MKFLTTHLDDHVCLMVDKQRSLILIKKIYWWSTLKFLKHYQFFFCKWRTVNVHVLYDKTKNQYLIYENYFIYHTHSFGIWRIYKMAEMISYSLVKRRHMSVVIISNLLSSYRLRQREHWEFWVVLIFTMQQIE